MSPVAIPRINWILIKPGISDLVFVCPACRMFSRLDVDVKISEAGLTSREVSCIHARIGCSFMARLRFTEWREKNEEIKKWAK